MRNATIPYRASVTFLLIVIYETTNFFRDDSLVKATLLIKNVSQNIGSILFTRNKASTGEQITIRGNDKRFGFYKAGQIFLPYIPDFHCDLVLNQAQMNIIAALFGLIPESSQLFVFHNQVVKIFPCPRPVKFLGNGNRFKPLLEKPFYRIGKSFYMARSHDTQRFRVHFCHDRQKRLDCRKRTLPIGIYP